MPYQSVTLRPGIDVEQTPVLNSAGWSASNNIRFFSGLPQKIGGWTKLNITQPLPTYGRGIHNWADNSGIPYVAIGTASSLDIFQNGLLYDITPLRTTTNNAPQFSTATSSKVVNIKDTGHGAVTGDRVNILVPVSVGGIIIQGYYSVTVVDVDNYTIIAASAATGNVTDGGAVPVFNTTASSPDVTVTLNDNGLTTGDPFTVQVSTAISTFTLLGVYAVTSVVDANNFKFQPGGVAGGTATVSENSGNARIEYLIHAGLDSAAYTSVGGGYGVGPYGGGPYGGSTTSTVLTQLRYWSLSNFGEDLIGNYNGSPLYVWVPPEGDDNIALELNTSNFPGAVDPPKQVNYSFGSATQEMIIALGCNIPNTSTFDPNLVRWCDAGDFTDWDATSTNQAGSFRIPSGSQLISGISTANFNVIWTDIDMWIMSYLGGELVWGFQKVADAVDIIAPLAAGVFRNTVIWPSHNGFYMYDGAGVRQIPCPVWDKFWFNLNQLQIYKVNAQVNSWFGEISWGYPSATGNGEVDSRITYNVRENAWSYDNVSRTCWIDDSVYGAPMGTDLNFYLQQHETSNDDDGNALPSSITSGWFAISETDYLMFIERLVADFIVTGGNQQVQYTIQTQDWPTGPVTTHGPYTWTAGGTGPEFSIIRARGRLAQITISSSSTGVFWRLGRLRYLGQQSGRGL